jgi:hypothetical protein
LTKTSLYWSPELWNYYEITILKRPHILSYADNVVQYMSQVSDWMGATGYRNGGDGRGSLSSLAFHNPHHTSVFIPRNIHPIQEKTACLLCEYTFKRNTL